MEGRASARRYWPGRAPTWLQDEKEAIQDEEEAGGTPERTAAAPAVVLRRAQAQVRPDPHEYVHGRVAARARSSVACDDARRTWKLTGNVSMPNRSKEDAKGGESSSTDGEEEGSSEYETDSSDEQENEALRLRPVFVPKNKRKAKEEEEMDEESWEVRKRKEAEQRRKETQELVALQLQEEKRLREEARNNGDVQDVDTDIEEGDTQEYEKWKEREIARLLRDHKLRMREKWGEEEEAEVPEEGTSTRKEKSKIKFMQKYWHKGAFFQEEKDDYAAPSVDREVYERDFSAPTGGDLFDKSKMPKVMQVRGDKFGRSGLSKYTHLVEEDTTDRDLKKQLDKKLVRNTVKRMGGMKDSFEKPSKRRK